MARVEVQSKQVGCSSWPTGKDVMTTSILYSSIVDRKILPEIISRLMIKNLILYTFVKHILCSAGALGKFIKRRAVMKYEVV